MNTDGGATAGASAQQEATVVTERPTVFLDRDGVLNKKPTQARYVRNWEEFEWLPGTREALRLFAEAGYRVVVISNQAGISRGVMSEEDVQTIHRRMREEATAAGGRIDAVYYCPHGGDDDCTCRKPKPGMLLQAQREFALDLSRVIFIGDDERDGQTSASAGCRWIQVTEVISLLDVAKEVIATVPTVSSTVGSTPLRSTLLVMTLNEIDGMRVIMPRIKREWVDQLLIVDGGSTDGTIEWAREHGYTVYIQRDPGFRNAYREIWPLVTGDIVIYFTPDGNSIPEVIPQLIERIGQGAELVIASRYLAGARSDDDDAVTRFGNWLFRTLSNRLLTRPGGKRMTDPMVMLRAHRKDLPMRLGLDRPEPFIGLERLFRTRVDWIPLMSMRALHLGVHWEEIPADEPARIGGVRKLRIFQWGAVYLLQLLGEWMRPWKGNT